MEKLHVETEQEERALEKFKEQKMEQTLDYNVRLSDLQQNYSRLAAKTLERSTYLTNIQEKSTEKRYSRPPNLNLAFLFFRLLISNIKLAILNMHHYVCKRAIILQGDKKEEGMDDKSVGEQLDSVISHIEDLKVVNERVANSDLAEGYLNPLASDKSEIRLDY